MAWNHTANVCAEDFQPVEALPEVQLAQPVLQSEVADTSQPLRREDCDQAGMIWNDTANVCAEAFQAVEVPETQASVTQTALEETFATTSTVLINIDKASQKMTVFIGWRSTI
jgi:flagellar hook-basal body complex protein FliE